MLAAPAGARAECWYGVFGKQEYFECGWTFAYLNHTAPSRTYRPQDDVDGDEETETREEEEDKKRCGRLGWAIRKMLERGPGHVAAAQSKHKSGTHRSRITYACTAPKRWAAPC